MLIRATLLAQVIQAGGLVHGHIMETMGGNPRVKQLELRTDLLIAPAMLLDVEYIFKVELYFSRKMVYI